MGSVLFSAIQSSPMIVIPNPQRLSFRTSVTSACCFRGRTKRTIGVPTTGAPRIAPPLRNLGWRKRRFCGSWGEGGAVAGAERASRTEQTALLRFRESLQAVLGLFPLLLFQRKEKSTVLMTDANFLKILAGSFQAPGLHHTTSFDTLELRF